MFQNDEDFSEWWKCFKTMKMFQKDENVSKR